MKKREIQRREGCPSWTFPPNIRVIVPDDEWMPWVEVAPLCAVLGIRVPDTLRAKAKADPNLEFGTYGGVEFATAGVVFQLVEAAGRDPLSEPTMALICRVALPNLVRFGSDLPAVESIDGPSRIIVPGIDEAQVNEAAFYFLAVGPASNGGRALLNQAVEGGFFRRFLTMTVSQTIAL